MKALSTQQPSRRSIQLRFNPTDQAVLETAMVILVLIVIGKAEYPAQSMNWAGYSALPITISRSMTIAVSRTA